MINRCVTWKQIGCRVKYRAYIPCKVSLKGTSELFPLPMIVPPAMLVVSDHAPRYLVEEELVQYQLKLPHIYMRMYSTKLQALDSVCCWSVSGRKILSSHKKNPEQQIVQQIRDSSKT